MSTAPASAPLTLLTAEEFGNRPDPGYPEELVRGRIVRMSPPNRVHGIICSHADRIIGMYVQQQGLGRTLTNDAGIITQRNPDSVRGADFAYYSYDRLPKGPVPPSYGPEVPELVVEVRSPSDRWRAVLEKVTEYLNAGVVVVLVLDPDTESAHVYRDNQAPETLQAGDELALPDILGDFRVRVAQFFE